MKFSFLFSESRAAARACLALNRILISVGISSVVCRPMYARSKPRCTSVRFRRTVKITDVWTTLARPVADAAAVSCKRKTTHRQGNFVFVEFRCTCPHVLLRQQKIAEKPLNGLSNQPKVWAVNTFSTYMHPRSRRLLSRELHRVKIWVIWKWPFKLATRIKLT